MSKYGDTDQYVRQLENDLQWLDRTGRVWHPAVMFAAESSQGQKGISNQREQVWSRFNAALTRRNVLVGGLCVKEPAFVFQSSAGQGTGGMLSRNERS